MCDRTSKHLPAKPVHQSGNRKRQRKSEELARLSASQCNKSSFSNFFIKTPKRAKRSPDVEDLTGGVEQENERATNRVESEKIGAEIGADSGKELDTNDAKSEKEGGTTAKSQVESATYGAELEGATGGAQLDLNGATGGGEPEKDATDHGAESEKEGAEFIEGATGGGEPEKGATDHGAESEKEGAEFIEGATGGAMLVLESATDGAVQELEGATCGGETEKYGTTDDAESEKDICAIVGAELEMCGATVVTGGPSFQKPELKFRNDPINFIMQKKKTEDFKRDFIKLGPCQPKPRPNYQREKIISKYYTESITMGNCTKEIQRSWLSYSQSLECAYCTVCLVFGEESKPGKTNKFREGTGGKESIHNFPRNVRGHDTTTSHVEACKAMRRVMLHKTITNSLMKETTELLDEKQRKALEMREFMYRVIDCIRYLASECDAFRGSDEKNFYDLARENIKHQTGAGKFLNLLNMMSSFDQVCNTRLTEFRETKKDLTRKPGKKTLGRGSRLVLISPTSITKMISILASMVRRRVADEISKAEFFSLIADGTTDKSLNEQMVIVVRYLHDDESCVPRLQVRERLLDMKYCEETTGEYFANKIKATVSEFGLDLTNTVGMSFDGASNNQGKEKGIVPRLKEVATMAINIYCSAHGSNLVNKATCRSSFKAVDLYGIEGKPGELQKLRTFLYTARERKKILTRYKNEVSGSRLKEKELAATHNVRFSAMAMSTKRVLDLYGPVLKTLQEISQDKKRFNATQIAEANGLLVKFSSYETLLTLILFNKIFYILKPLNDQLQGRGTDLAIVISYVEKAEGKLQKLRDNVDECFAESTVLATDYGMTETELKRKRVSLKRRLSVEESLDSRSSEPNVLWRREVAYAAIDTALQVMSTKFSGQKEVLLGLRPFLPSSFSENADINVEILKKDIAPYVKHLGLEKKIDDIAISLYDVRQSVVEHQPQLVNDPLKGTFFAVYQYLINRGVQGCCDTLLIIYQILSTIPTTSCEAERAFSKLTRTKDNLSNRLTSEHTSDRVVMASEKDILWELQYEDIIQLFADTDEKKRVLYG